MAINKSTANDEDMSATRKRAMQQPIETGGGKVLPFVPEYTPIQDETK